MAQSHASWANQGTACHAGAENGQHCPQGKESHQNLSAKCRAGRVLIPTPGHPMLHAPRRGVPHQTILPGGQRGKSQELQAPVSFGTRTRPPAAMETSIFHPGGHAKGHRHRGHLREPEGHLEKERPGGPFPAGDGQALGVLPKGAVVAASQMALSDPASWDSCPCTVPTP